MTSQNPQPGEPLHPAHGVESAILMSLSAISQPGAADGLDGPIFVNLRAHLDVLIRSASFPRLTVENVTDDGETFVALRCPVCGSLVTDEDLALIQVSERRFMADEIMEEDFIHERITFEAGGIRFGSSNLSYYLHDDRCMVALPENWKVEN